MELKRFYHILRKRMYLISLIVIAVCVITGIKSFLYTEDVYRANAKLIVSQSFEVEGTQVMNMSLIQSNIMLINSYKEIIHSSAILNKVVEKYPDLQASPGEINAKTTVSAANDSQVMNITVVDSSYKRAAEIANAVSMVFKENIQSIMHVDNVTILSEADTSANGAPVNSSAVLTIVISFIISLMISVGIAFLLDYLDDTIKTESDVVQTLGLPMLSYISKINKSEMKARSSRGIKQKAGEGAYAAAKQ
ncbi:capsular polysaccharide biosynthesis protein [Paenibacillus sp. CCS19]|uniref:YveK family protein n=1 Tax=Paenibacillus sp. CCS19 TaxID=3158387 RepID=UPI002568F9C2|nr:Wzz/FepE/Etk N-terminal domain-containing protein [Paenibacillus cellulosilyticus]GMK41177.1 capsular polysaccharide biosynthesis protein [Paenibacillus cellulosilyticus]